MEPAPVVAGFSWVPGGYGFRNLLTPMRRQVREPTDSTECHDEGAHLVKGYALEER